MELFQVFFEELHFQSLYDKHHFMIEEELA